MTVATPLAYHTISSTCIGYNEFGRPIFDTQRSLLGELLFRLKSRGHVQGTWDLRQQ
jgi:hypothetical protein